MFSVFVLNAAYRRRGVSLGGCIVLRKSVCTYAGLTSLCFAGTAQSTLTLRRSASAGGGSRSLSCDRPGTILPSSTLEQNTGSAHIWWRWFWNGRAGVSGGWGRRAFQDYLHILHHHLPDLPDSITERASAIGSAALHGVVPLEEVGLLLLLCVASTDRV